MDYAQLLDKVKAYVLQFFQSHENPPLLYHNVTHTQRVVLHTAEMANHYQLNARDEFILMAAAWFHDTGYYLGGATQHELAGANMAENFLLQEDIDNETILAVKQCIIATAMPQSPNNLLEEIICDADLYHLGTDEFGTQNKLMRKEASMRRGVKISKSEWLVGTLALMEKHQYKTAYARQLLEAKKQDNIRLLKEKSNEENEVKADSIISSTSDQPVDGDPKKREKADKPKDADKPGRGIETMFRVSSNNHQRLSDMADNKAHIMVTTTSIILSVLLSLLLRKLEDNPNLVIPTILLLVVCVVTMVFSILATRPKLPKGRFTEQDLTDKKVNLLFFGNFFRMNFDDYNRGMQQMMNDRDFLYGSLTRDLYSQGIVLGHKYRLLRIGYNIFMYGIIISVLAFLIAIGFYG